MAGFFGLQLQRRRDGERLTKLFAALDLLPGNARHEGKILMCARLRARCEPGIERVLDVACGDLVVAFLVLAHAGIEHVLGSEMSKRELLNDWTLACAQQPHRTSKQKCATDRARHGVAYLCVNLCLILIV